jgi:hypothetical protein
VEEILSRACEDIVFRESLLASPETALADSGLSDQALHLLAAMRRVALEEWGIDVRRSRAFLRDNGNKVEPPGVKRRPGGSVASRASVQNIPLVPAE